MSFAMAGQLKMHYMELGDGDPILMVHGNPTWSLIGNGGSWPVYAPCGLNPWHLRGAGASERPPASNLSQRPYWSGPQSLVRKGHARVRHGRYRVCRLLSRWCKKPVVD